MLLVEVNGMVNKQHYRIIDSCTGVAVPTMYTYYASSPRGAIRMFRQRYALAHNYPFVVAVPAQDTNQADEVPLSD